MTFGMASLHKDPRNRSPYWYCAFTGADGRRVFKSTKLKDRSSALDLGLKWERAAKEARAGRFSEPQARKILNEFLEATGQGVMNTATVKQFFDDWLESKRAAKALGTARRYENVMEPFIASLGNRANIQLASLTPRDVQKFLDEQAAGGLANKTRNFSLKAIRAVLNSARRHGIVLTNVAEAIDTLPDNSAERGTFTPDEVQKILKVADQEWRGVILLGLCAGLRLGDAAQITWANVDLAARVIRYQPQKTSKLKAKRASLEVPILDDLSEYLIALPVSSKDPKAPLFPKLAKCKVEGRTGLSNTFTRLIESAGIENEPVAKARGKSGRTVFRLSFHSTRHTFVSMMANLGVAKELRMKLAGHTSSAHDRYTHLEVQTLRDALAEFPRFT